MAGCLRSTWSTPATERCLECVHVEHLHWTVDGGARSSLQLLLSTSKHSPPAKTQLWYKELRNTHVTHRRSVQYRTWINIITSNWTMSSKSITYCLAAQFLHSLYSRINILRTSGHVRTCTCSFKLSNYTQLLTPATFLTLQQQSEGSSSVSAGSVNIMIQFATAKWRDVTLVHCCSCCCCCGWVLVEDDAAAAAATLGPCCWMSRCTSAGILPSSNSLQCFLYYNSNHLYNTNMTVHVHHCTCTSLFYRLYM